jgi:endo-1,4-beta-xylanase
MRVPAYRVSDGALRLTANNHPNKKSQIMNKRRNYHGVAVLCLTLLAGGWQAKAQTTLSAAYGKMFAVGAAIPSPDLSDAEKKVLLDNFTNITPENCLKPKYTEPEEGRYSFEDGDALVDFANQNGLKMNGHCLVWHGSCPNWFFLDNGKPASRDLVLKRMRDHITTEVSHFKGRVFSWDVVNEALDNGTDYLKKTKWQKSIGDDYVAEAFKAAQAADPNAELYYNDYGIEHPLKRAKALRLIADLKRQHIRIDGIGIQGHWALDQVPFQQIEDSIEAFHKAGVKVMITELDIDMVPRQTAGADTAAHETGNNDPLAAGCPPELLQRQAEQYAKLFTLFRKHAADISRVTFWGLGDGRSWLNDWPWKRTNYPLLWDRQMKPKPAFDAVLAAARGQAADLTPEPASPGPN